MTEAPNPEGRRTVRLVIRGRVQGVSYRYWAVREAEARALSGWVRNRRDGSVEALISGPSAMVDAMIEACRLGPPAARVTDIEIIPESGTETGRFRQEPTA